MTSTNTPSTSSVRIQPTIHDSTWLWSSGDWLWGRRCDITGRIPFRHSEGRHSNVAAKSNPNPNSTFGMATPESTPTCRRLIGFDASPVFNWKLSARRAYNMTATATKTWKIISGMYSLYFKRGSVVSDKHFSCRNKKASCYIIQAQISYICIHQI